MSTSTPSEPAVEALDLRRAARRGLVFVVVLALLAVALSALPGLDEVRERFASAAPVWLAAAVLFEVGSTASFPVALRGAFSRIMPWRPAFALGLVEQATNVLVPAGGSGGLAFGAVLMQRRGLPASFAATRTVVLFLVTSLMTFIAIIVAGAAIGLGADGGDFPALAAVLVAAAAAVAIGAVALISKAPASVVEHSGRLRRLVAWLRDAVADGVRATIALLRRGDALLIAGSIGYLAFDMEGSLIGMFVLCGASLGAATAAVLAYRVIQLGVPALLGALASIDLRRMIRTGPTPAEIAERHLNDPRLD